MGSPQHEEESAGLTLLPGVLGQGILKDDQACDSSHIQARVRKDPEVVAQVTRGREGRRTKVSCLSSLLVPGMRSFKAPVAQAVLGHKSKL